MVVILGGVIEEYSGGAWHNFTVTLTTSHNQVASLKMHLPGLPSMADSVLWANTVTIHFVYVAAKVESGTQKG